MNSETHLSQAEIASIFERTKHLYPQLLVNHTTGEEYTTNHPVAEGLATIFKIKLDEFDYTQSQIEKGKKRCLAAMGCSSVQELYERTTRRQLDFPVEQQKQHTPCTLGDFLNVQTTQSKRRNRKHK
jgi:hypothetical protein